VKKIDRRSFVKSTTISSGALITVPFSLDAMANSFNNRKLKLAVIGCGGRGTGAVIQALKADKDVVLDYIVPVMEIANRNKFSLVLATDSKK